MNHFEYMITHNKGLMEFYSGRKKTPITYEEAFVKLRQEMPDHYDVKDVATAAIMLFHTINMLVNGSKIYKINEPLHLVMMNTDAKNLTAEQVKFPFPEFFIEAPDTNWYKEEFKIYHNNEYQKAAGFYVNAAYNHTHYDPFTQLERTDYLFLRIMVVGEIKKDWKESNFYFFNLAFENKETTIEQAVYDLISKWNNEDIRQKFSIDTSDENIKFTRQLFNYILNIVMYITAKNNDVQFIKSNFDAIKNAGSIARKIRKYKHKDVVNKHYIYLPRENMQMFNKNAGPKHGVSLDKTIFVSGFWRWQACGPKWSEHKLTWIAPYQKGDGEISQTTYIVKEKQE